MWRDYMIKFYNICVGIIMSTEFTFLISQVSTIPRQKTCSNLGGNWKQLYEDRYTLMFNFFKRSAGIRKVTLST